MSLGRLITRLAVVNAINGFSKEPYPTLAGPNIFDSKIEPLENIQPKEVYPICVVYTDYDKDHYRHGNKAGAKRLLTITIELLIAQMTKEAGSDFYEIALPHTDSELESSIDIFETQVFRALEADNSAANVFRYMANGYENVISRRGADVNGGQRLCARQITMELSTLRDPIESTIPAAIAAFLDDLEATDDYRIRVPDIREAYMAGDDMTAAERLIRTMGWSKSAAGILGYERGVQPVLPPSVTWLDQHGNSL